MYCSPMKLLLVRALVVVLSKEHRTSVASNTMLPFVRERDSEMLVPSI